MQTPYELNIMPKRSLIFIGVRADFCDFTFLAKQTKCHVPIAARYESVEIAIVVYFTTEFAVQVARSHCHPPRAPQSSDP